VRRHVRRRDHHPGADSDDSDDRYHHPGADSDDRHHDLDDSYHGDLDDHDDHDDSDDHDAQGASPDKDHQTRRKGFRVEHGRPVEHRRILRGRCPQQKRL